MKKLLLACLMLATVAVSAQKSVLLRLNPNQGDIFLVNVEQIQNLGLQGGINMKIAMNMKFTDVTNDEIKSESTIESIVMDMNQAGQNIKYDSRMDENDLDATGKMMKSQMDPMLTAVITSTQNRLGKTISSKVEPNVASLQQMADQTNSIVYPSEAVSVGSTWTSEDENQGMKMKTTYKVVNIDNNSVYVDISGTVAGMGDGTISGKTVIDINTGIQKNAEVEVKVNAGGMEVKVIAKSTMTKM